MLQELTVRLEGWNGRAEMRVGDTLTSPRRPILSQSYAFTLENQLLGLMASIRPQALPPIPSQDPGPQLRA